jgi:glyoxylase-like metal-dependent hydrolase (beta-lactamase superfamily II)
MDTLRHVTPEIDILPSVFPVPGLGMVPVNAFLIRSTQPVLVDTGLHMDHDAFMAELEQAIDPEEVRWLWLTHPDADHIGSLKTMLERAPNMKIITTFLGVGIMMLSMDVPLDRVYLLNAGESIDVGDRRLTAVKPPTFDNPATMGFYDDKSRIFFSSDSFGALLQETAADAGDIAPDALRQGQVLWTTVDSPWLHKVDPTKFAAELNSIRQMEPSFVLSSHLPPAKSMNETMLGALVAASEAQPFVGPNQAALEAMLAQMTGAPAGVS